MTDEKRTVGAQKTEAHGKGEPAPAAAVAAAQFVKKTGGPEATAHGRAVSEPLEKASHAVAAAQFVKDRNQLEAQIHEKAASEQFGKGNYMIAAVEFLKEAKAAGTHDLGAAVDTTIDEIKALAASAKNLTTNKKSR